MASINLGLGVGTQGFGSIVGFVKVLTETLEVKFECQNALEAAK